jgi:hypothetical protein
LPNGQPAPVVMMIIIEVLVPVVIDILLRVIVVLKADADIRFGVILAMAGVRRAAA